MSDNVKYPAKSKYASLEYAEHYDKDRFQSGVASREEKMVLSLLELCQEYSSILDAPCGTGRISKLFPDKAVTGFDVSESMLKVAGRLPNVTTQQGDIEKLPFEDRQFDLVLSIRFLHHMPSDEAFERSFSELCRVTGKNLIITYYDQYSLQQIRRKVKRALFGRESHRHGRSWDLVQKVAEKNGLKVVSSKCSAPMFSEQWFVLFERVDDKG